jgi:hypothetical protein
LLSPSCLLLSNSPLRVGSISDITQYSIQEIQSILKIESCRSYRLLFIITIHPLNVKLVIKRVYFVMNFNILHIKPRTMQPAVRKLTLIFFIVFTSITARSQQATIKGNIYDTINKEHLSNTVIALLRSKDSVLYKFTRSDKDGNFALQQVAPGKYVVLITENTYADYIDNISINGDTTITLGTLPMTLKGNLLKEVIVQQQIAAMRMKGDTLEYAADSFKVRQGA